VKKGTRCITLRKKLKVRAISNSIHRQEEKGSNPEKKRKKGNVEKPGRKKDYVVIRRNGRLSRGALTNPSLFVKNQDGARRSPSEGSGEEERAKKCLKKSNDKKLSRNFGSRRNQTSNKGRKNTRERDSVQNISV